MKKAIYKFKAECGRQGTLEGCFIADKKMVEVLISEKIEVYYGEVLGKHSEIYGNVEPNELTMVTDDNSIIEMFEKHQLYSGINPFDYGFINYSNEKIDTNECEDVYSLCELLIK